MPPPTRLPPRFWVTFYLRQPFALGNGFVEAMRLGVARARVTEDQLEQQVWIGLSSDGHPQRIAVGEIELGFPSRWMLLGEVHLLVGSMQRPPIL